MRYRVIDQTSKTLRYRNQPGKLAKFKELKYAIAFALTRGNGSRVLDSVTQTIVWPFK